MASGAKDTMATTRNELTELLCDGQAGLAADWLLDAGREDLAGLETADATAEVLRLAGLCDPDDNPWPGYAAEAEDVVWWLRSGSAGGIDLAAEGVH
jgi:hypothetical protein